MKKVLLLVALLISITATGQQLTTDQVLRRAYKFTNSLNSSNRIPLQQPSLQLAAQSTSGCWYAYNCAPNGGFVIASGDSRTAPILGYSDSGNFNIDSIPPQLAWLLNAFEQRLSSDTESASLEYVESASATQNNHADINALISSEWGQRSPYNAQCPSLNGETCVTGCVATAMAQVLRYAQLPQSECNGIPAYNYSIIYNGDSCNMAVDSLPPTTFNWSAMTDKYTSVSNSTSQEAVAKLMRYCGQSVKMKYSPSSSSASTSNEHSALTKYFGCDSDVRYLKAEYFSDSAWAEKLYEELSQQRPVLLSGQSTSGGHAFVCDGYEASSGFFHINWGWNGSYNGYFDITLLKPNGTGTGGGSANAKYNQSVDGIFGIKAEDGMTDDANDRITVLGLDTTTTKYTRASVDKAFYVTLKMSLENQTGKANNYAIGYVCYDENNNLISETTCYNNKTFSAGLSSTITSRRNVFAGETGTYRYVPVCKLRNEGDWVECVNADYYYYTMIVTDSTLFLYVGDPSNPTIGGVKSIKANSLTFEGKKVIGNSLKLIVNITNDGLTDYNGDIYLIDSYNSGNYYIGSTNVKLAKGETADFYFTLTPSVATTHKFKIYKKFTNNYLYNRDLLISAEVEITEQGTGIKDINSEEQTFDVYDISGQLLKKGVTNKCDLPKGINILRWKNGTTEKTVVR